MCKCMVTPHTIPSVLLDLQTSQKYTPTGYNLQYNMSSKVLKLADDATISKEIKHDFDKTIQWNVPF